MKKEMVFFIHLFIFVTRRGLVNQAHYRERKHHPETEDNDNEEVNLMDKVLVLGLVYARR